MINSSKYKLLDLSNLIKIFEQLKDYFNEKDKYWDLEKIICDMNLYVYRVIRSSNKEYKYVTACYALILSRKKKLRWIKAYEIKKSFSNSIEESWKLSDFDSEPEFGSLHNKRIRI